MRYITQSTVIGLVVLLCAGDNLVAGKSSLKLYRQKRKFEQTPEPRGAAKKKSAAQQPMFVIQQHDATRLHYDLRLEMNGVLKSWAVPKGPSLNPAVKRLAILTEDHPIEYGHFEGVIPIGNYGAGTVMVWDVGFYELINGKSMQKAFERGFIEICFDGKKLQGNFALIRTSPQKNWLLVKMHDEYASKRKNPVSTQKKSALTNRTMSEIRLEGRTI